MNEDTDLLEFLMFASDQQIVEMFDGVDIDHPDAISIISESFDPDHHAPDSDHKERIAKVKHALAVGAQGAAKGAGVGAKVGHAVGSTIGTSFGATVGAVAGVGAKVATSVAKLAVKKIQQARVNRQQSTHNEHTSFVQDRDRILLENVRKLLEP